MLRRQPVRSVVVTVVTRQHSAHKCPRMGRSVFHGHLSVTRHRVRTVVGEPFAVNEGILCTAAFRRRIREGVLAPPLVAEPPRSNVAPRSGQGSEVAVHKGPAARIVLCRSLGGVIRRPNMPRPKAVVPLVEESDQSVSRRRSRREADFGVQTMHGPDHGAARRTCFPDHLGRRAVKVVGRDARRRPAVARDVCIEFVTALPLRGDIAVGGSRRGEVLGGMVERIDAAVAGRREGVARLFGQQPGGGGVPPV